MSTIFKGNLEDKKYSEKRGWFIGHFIEKNSLFNNKDFEVRWAVHKKGDKKSNVAKNLTAKTISILIKGRLLIKFPKDKKEILLKKQGDFAFWKSNVLHTSESLEDSVVLTIRWPSIPNDQKSI